MTSAASIGYGSGHMPTDLARKLQLKEGQSLYVSNLPAGLQLDVSQAQSVVSADAVLSFVVMMVDVAKFSADVVEFARADKLSWLAYPKGGQLGTDLNRDILWRELESEGVSPVRQISIDSIWSSMRFRPAK